MSGEQTSNLSYFLSPAGLIKITASEDGLRSVQFTNDLETAAGTILSENPVIRTAILQLTEYFEGNRKVFDIPLDPEGTDFRKQVWQELLKIPFGTTISYLELARRLGDEKVIRAAASANGSNPIAILIPCHRVIGADGSLTGYAGGMHRKQWLLEHEKGFVQGSLF